MASLSTAERQLLDTLRDKLIPWADGGVPFVLLGAPPKIIGSNAVREEAAEALPTLKGAGLKVHVQVWKEQNLNSMTMPYLGCVVEGEADIVTATTEAMCRSLQISGKRWIVNALAKSFLLTPPKIPVSGGERPHWEMPNPEKAYSKILWMQFHATGISWHFCTTDQGKHWSHPLYFISGTEFLPLSQKLIHEMTLQSQQYLPLVYHYLSILFHYMVRELQAKPALKNQEMNAADFFMRVGRNDDVTHRAIAFIDENLNRHSLSVEQVAAHLQLSSRHLARIFKRDTERSLLTFITEQRMKLACQHLTQSQYSIRKIAGNVGYTTSSSFIKAFLRHFGVSPTAYRIAHQGNVRNGQQVAGLENENSKNFQKERFEK